MTEKFDVIIVGTGFASSFFLQAYLEKANPRERILVLERGRHNSHAWQLQNRTNTDIASEDTFANANPEKKWVYNLSFGGGSNCWWAVTPRMLPNDFRMKSVYGVGVDWPVSYDELEKYYYQVEDTMSVSGPQDGSPYPREKPYPQAPHRFSDPDQLLKKAYPDLYFQQPTARARVGTRNRRACCATGVCGLCPVDAKFTILNEMGNLYHDQRVSLLFGANVLAVETSGGVATGVRYLRDGVESTAKGDLVVLGANAIFNPYILLRSNLPHVVLGTNLHEQRSINVSVKLDGLDNFQGSTSIVGHGYMIYDGPHRSQHAACLIESLNIPTLRLEPGKWRQLMEFRFIFEDLPSEKNFVRVKSNDPSLPETVYGGHSAYTQRAIDRLPAVLPQLLRPLPVESFIVGEKPDVTEAHILGTTRMGDDPATSVVDRHLIHHQVRNLVVLGSSVFPTGGPANPTLTLSALSLWSAEHLLR